MLQAEKGIGHFCVSLHFLTPSGFNPEPKCRIDTDQGKPPLPFPGATALEDVLGYSHL